MANLRSDAEDRDVKVEGEAKFYSGDWASLSTYVRTYARDKRTFFKREKLLLLFPGGGGGGLLGASPKYDLIITAETIYNMNCQHKLLDLLDKCLAKEGRVLLASKIHYFGVGGGLRQFEALLEECKKWDFKTVMETGATNLKREIIELKRRERKAE